jgi:hypothetical protein
MVVPAFGLACSVTTSLGGLTGGSAEPDSSRGEDAPSVEGHDAGVETENDAGIADDGDAASDTGAFDAADASDASTLCASQSPAPLFCDDFDEDPLDAAVLAAAWDQVTQVGGSVSRSEGIVTSPPFAMLSTSTSPVTATIDLAGYKTFPALTQSEVLTLAFDVYVVAPDKTKKSDAVLAALELVGATQRWALQLEAAYDADAGRGEDLDVILSENREPGTDAGTYTAHAVSQGLPVGAWRHVSMSASVPTTGDATIALEFGTTGVAKDDVAIGIANAQPEILVGLTFASISTEGWAVRYDNVTFTTDP